MKELEMLLRQRWILKADQKEQYTASGITLERSANLHPINWGVRSLKIRCL